GLWRRRDPLAGRAVIPVAAAVLSCLAAAACAWPPADSTVAHLAIPRALPEDDALTRIVVALVPIPRVGFFFWNNNLLMDWAPFRRIAGWVAILCAGGIVVAL